MDTKHQIQAMNKFEKGYNCAQTVACTYADEIGLEEELIFRLTEGFGGGFAHMGHMCGVLSGLTMVESYRMCKDMEHMPEGKFVTYEQIQPLIQRFEAEMGYVNCHDILAHHDQTLIQGKKACCRACVKLACQILDERFVEA